MRTILLMGFLFVVGVLSIVGHEWVSGSAKVLLDVALPVTLGLMAGLALHPMVSSRVERLRMGVSISLGEVALVVQTPTSFWSALVFCASYFLVALLPPRWLGFS